MKSDQLENLQVALGYRFTRIKLLQRALTHSSHARELEAADSSKERKQPAAPYLREDNEQLEFLGDAILGMVTAEELYRRFPDYREGKLSKLRAHLVSQKHLIKVAAKLGVGDHLRLGRGEEKSGGREKPALLVDGLEAILAAIYLDGGLEEAQRLVIERVIGPELQRRENGIEDLPLADFKSALQEKLQSSGRPQPIYALVKEEGPEHRKMFTVEARLQSGKAKPAEFVGRAQASTKKSAEQAAARQIMEYLETISATGVESHVK